MDPVIDPQGAGNTVSCGRRSWRCRTENLSYFTAGHLLRGQPQQLEQPGVLCPQPGQLSLNRHRILSHRDALPAQDRTDLASSGQGPRRIVPNPAPPLDIQDTDTDPG